MQAGLFGFPYRRYRKIEFFQFGIAGKTQKYSWNDKLCKLIWSKIGFADFPSAEQVSRAFPTYEKMIGNEWIERVIIYWDPSSAQKTGFLKFKNIVPICQVNVMKLTECIADLVRGKAEELALDILNLKNYNLLC